MSRRGAVTRRGCLHTAGLAAAACGGALHASASRGGPAGGPARIALTLDLEMSRNFPTWESTHWDYEKGNLDEPTKRYTVEAARRVRAAGGVVHCFVVGRVLEQPDVGWLAGLAADGHPLGNHTYDHVNVRATRAEDLQPRFQRAPWLLRGQSAAEAIRENILLTTKALRQRLGVAPAGFRTPGGFADGLRQHGAVRTLLADLGFSWVSSLYPAHPVGAPFAEPSAAVLDGIVAAHAAAQPHRYPDGLVEVPMSPISDIGAFRTGRWRLPWFLDALRRCITWTIDHGAVFDFLGHPSCLSVVDPGFEAIDLICGMVRDAGDRAALVDLDTIAREVPDAG